GRAPSTRAPLLTPSPRLHLAPCAAPPPCKPPEPIAAVGFRRPIRRAGKPPEDAVATRGSAAPGVLHLCGGVMDQLKRSLLEIEEKAAKSKKEVNNEYSKIKLDLTNSYIEKMKEQEQTEKALSLERDQLEKAQAKELSEFAKSLEKEQVANLKNALREQGVLFAGMKEQERAIADNVLGNTRREKDKIINQQEQTLDSFYKHARLQFEELQNDVSGLKDMIQNLIEQQEVRPDKKSKV
ncbi:unnamed protein product, partial [Urochloa humidicola]